MCLASPGGHNYPDLLLDMATSVVAMGKLRVSANKKEKVPLGLLLDCDGEPTTNPGDAFASPTKAEGAALPLGLAPDMNYKGFGLALFCDILAGALSGAGTVASEQDDSKKSAAGAGGANSLLMILLDPERMGGLDHLRVSRQIE
jgi:uncharacterized oxidoreductase